MEAMKLFQTVNYLLKKYDGRLNYTKLIKILYLADRKSLKETGRSITEDNYCCMKLGPVLENLYSLITGNCSDSSFQLQWSNLFVKDGFDLVGISDKLPDGELSRYEKRIIDEIDKTYHDVPYQKMVEIVHDKSVCPEWEMPSSGKAELSKEKILSCVGFSNEQIEQILEEDQVYENDKKIFDNLQKECM